MKDLANLYYFEKLLEDVNNDLVRQAQAKGDIAIGAVCFQIPEPLINLPGSFSVRLRAPRTGSIEMGTYYMSSMLCEGCRASLESLCITESSSRPPISISFATSISGILLAITPILSYITSSSATFLIVCTT